MLILLRHGRTKANAGGLLQGRIDLELDDLGQQQAQAAAAAIGKADRVIASPLVRAQQTAAAFGQPVETDERFIELDYGDWEAKPVKDVPVETWNEWRSDLDFRPPNGETLNELGSRVRGALADLAAEAVHQNIVVVSHVSPIKASVAWALGTGDETTWRLFLGQASICRVATTLDSARLIEFNVTAHLDGLG
ncbi:MAG: histidine phosphatase family protein [Acidimicrobiales bacterium]|jgi:broad specificity phosphatase PhoE